MMALLWLAIGFIVTFGGSKLYDMAKRGSNNRASRGGGNIAINERRQGSQPASLGSSGSRSGLRDEWPGVAKQE